jgi:acetyl esterase
MADMTVEQLLQMMATMPPPKSVEDLRGMVGQMSVMFNQDPPTIGALHEAVVLRNTGGVPLTADVAVPAGKGPYPVLLYLHGGGWVAGSPHSHRKLGMQFAQAGYLTVNLDYRLAPEHPFPAGLDDCVFAVAWTRENAARYGGNPTRLAIGGDSAGGNLSAATLVALGGGTPAIKAALLIYGVFDMKAMLAAHPQDAGPLSHEAVIMMAEAYMGKDLSDAVVTNPRISPMYGLQKNFPPCFIICGTLDPLLPQSQRLAKVCQERGITHELQIVENVPHGFLQMSMFPGCAEGFNGAVRFLQKHV